MIKTWIARIARAIAMVGFVAIVLFVVLGAASAFMPGTKVGPLRAMSADELAGEGEGERGKPRTLKEFAAGQFGEPTDAGTAPDAGTSAATPAGQGSAAPVESQPLPEQQGR